MRVNLQVLLEEFQAEVAEPLALLDRLDQAAAEIYEYFEDFEEQPELTTEVLNLLMKALARVEGASDQAREASNDQERMQALAVIRDNLATVVGVQAGYRQAVYAGPALHPFLNRILLHMGYFFRGGRARAETDELLLGLPDFVHDVGRALTEVRDATARVSIQGHLGNLVTDCEDFREWLDARELSGLESIQLDLLRHSEDITLELASQLEANLLQGPTAWAAANIVDLAVDRYLAGSIGRELVAEALEQMKQLLNFRVSPAAEPALVAAADEVRAQLLQVSAASAAELKSACEDLMESTRTVLKVAARLARDEAELDLVQGDLLASEPEVVLPPLLASLHQLSEAFVGGTLPASRLEEGIETLELLTRRCRESSESKNDEQQQAVTIAIEKLELAAFCLHNLAASRLNTDLNHAYDAMVEATTELARANDLTPERGRVTLGTNS